MNQTTYFNAFLSIEVALLPWQEKLRNGDYFERSRAERVTR